GKGPTVVEVPPLALGTADDMWFRWIVDLGLPGPDRGEGGRYLFLPPDYAGVVPEGGYHVARSATTHVVAFSRFFLEKDDPKPVAERIKKQLKISPYKQGGYGTSVAAILEGKAAPSALAPAGEPPPTRFVEASGKAFNTTPAGDYRFFEQV